ncbi:MAG: DUF192 domain-containing protein [Betaproteobacteria bacterium]|nr:DUF192 domain-containing protein [Betaproteobacteria bacterium]
MIAPRSNLHGLAAALALWASLLLPPLATHAKEPQRNLPTLQLSAGGQSIRADVAATDATREKGLMFREKMGRNEGMLFVFSYLGYHAMWMRNTPLPLSVAFMDDKGTILSIHDMDPFSENLHQSAGPARFALEMNKGWFATAKVKVGDQVKGLEKAPKPQ